MTDSFADLARKTGLSQSILKTRRISQVENRSGLKFSASSQNPKMTSPSSSVKRVTFSNSLVTIHEVESYKKYNAMSEGSGQWCTGCSLV